MGIEERLEPEEARRLIASNEVTVLDVRGDEQWLEKRIAGSERVSEDDLESRLSDLDEDRDLLIVCEDGERSAQVASGLREQGREAGCIDGGIEAWEKEKLPMQPSVDAADDAKV
jgi:rhodanese-related sulfurtransferase